MTAYTTEQCEIVMDALLAYLHDEVSSAQVVDRGEEKIPGLSQFPCIVILDGPDEIFQQMSRGCKRAWQVCLALFVQGTSEDDQIQALAEFREEVRDAIKSSPKALHDLAASISETAREAPVYPELGNFVIAQGVECVIKYIEP